MVFMCSDHTDEQCWYIDSGATQHMSGDRDAFVDYECIPAKAVYLGRQVNAKFTNVLYVPNLKSNLISVSRLIKDGFNVQIGAAGCDILKNGAVVAQGVSENRLYRLCGRIVYYDRACLAQNTLASLASTHCYRLMQCMVLSCRML